MNRQTSATPGSISRRDTLKWLAAASGVIAAAGTLPGCATTAEPGDHAPWPTLQRDPVTTTGYGTDPDLITPAPVPWPKLMTGPELATTAVLADIIIPAEGDVPSASAVGVVEFVDEWISAPYPRQQADRSLIGPGLAWLDVESRRRFSNGFVALSAEQQLQIIDDIADTSSPAPASLTQPKRFFAVFRMLVVGAFFTTPEGTADLGYIGNIPIAGDYPGPTPEAHAHLQTLLAQLGLEPG